MGLNILLSLAHQDFESVKVVSFRVCMKVKLLILHEVLVLTRIEVSHVLVAQHLLSSCFNLQKVYAENAAVGRHNVLKMQIKRSTGQLKRPRELHVLLHALLFPKYGHRPTNLCVRDQCIANDHYLLLLALISDVPELINAASVVPRARPMVNSA